MKKFIFFTALAMSHALTASADDQSAPGKQHTPQMSYLENESIRLGVDLDIGGAITYLAPVTNRELNVINSHDWGRQVQLSYYSGPNPFNPPGTTMSQDWHFLGWNPIQSGDCFGFKSVVLTHTNDGRSLYVKLVPMQWPLKNVPGECVCEVWLELDGPTVKARTRLTNQRADHTQYPARTQEMPAVYVNGPYCRLFTYTGDRPYTGGALTQFTNRLDLEKHWTSWLAPEHWAAQVNDAGWGLGIWTPETTRISGGFFSEPGAGGPTDAPTGYLAPNRREILDYNIVFDYRYELVLGTLAEIRAQAMRHAEAHILPRWEFTTDRHGWSYHGAGDTGWPIHGELKISPRADVSPDRNAPAAAQWQILSPEFFVRTDQVAKLVVEAALARTGKTVAVFWRGPAGRAASWQEAGKIPVAPDGQMRRYELPLKISAAESSALTELRFDLASAETNALVRLRSVALE